MFGKALNPKLVNHWQDTNILQGTFLPQPQKWKIETQWFGRLIRGCYFCLLPSWSLWFFFLGTLIDEAEPCRILLWSHVKKLQYPLNQAKKYVPKRTWISPIRSAVNEISDCPVFQLLTSTHFAIFPSWFLSTWTPQFIPPVWLSTRRATHMVMGQKGYLKHPKHPVWGNDK